MKQSVAATVDGLEIEVELDFESWHWSSVAHPAEGEFPIVVHADAKRYELYSDKTFAEVEDDEPGA